jgi:hypothetical protein
MADQLHWAARYQFLEELWRDQDRLILDPAVEEAVQEGGPGVAHGSDQPLMDLFDDLVPRESHDAQAWVVVDRERRAADEIAAEEPWQVALVDVGTRIRFLRNPAEPDRIESEFDTDFAAFIELLAEGAEEGKTVVLWAGIEGDPADGDHLLEGFEQFIDEHFAEARIFGAARLQMAAFYDFSPEDQDGEDEEVGIDFDNRLGSEEPQVGVFVAIAGAEIEMDGLTLMELPSVDPAPAGATTTVPPSAVRFAGGSGALKQQLAEAQRATDEAAIERQRLIEQLDAAEDRCAGLEEQLEERGTPEELGDSGARLDAALANEQTLRWQINRLEGEVEALRGRPVETLEAEIASLESRVKEAAASRAQQGSAQAGPRTGSASAGAEASEHPETATEALRQRLDRILQRLERGGMPTLELHRELSELRRRLR